VDVSAGPPVALVDLGGALGKRVCVSLSGERGERTHVSPVVRQVLLRCAESCERALNDYRKVAGGRVTGRELFGDLLRAIATVRTAADLLDEADSRRELAFRLTAEACGAAAVRCRQAGLDESLLRCAAACDRAADEAELVLTAIAHEAHGHS
jgi:hypothetical protein